MTTICDTSTLPPSERNEYWVALALAQTVPHEVCSLPASPLSGRMAGIKLGQMQLGTVAASPQTMRRTSRMVADTPADYYTLSLMLEGRAIASQDGRNAIQRRGDFIVYDCSRVLEFVSDGDFRLLNCLIPHAWLSIPPQHMARITATSISGESGIGWALAPFLDRLARLEDGHGVGDVQRVVQGTIELVAALCEGQLRGGGEPTGSQMGLVLRVRAYIEANLGEADLSPESVARAHFVSKRSLHRLFQGESTSVSRLIRERRLERCRQQLCDPDHAHESVSSIGARWGLSDPAQLSRLFRDAYDCTPREYRRQALVDQTRVVAA
jgi:AraC-like DNA-binding protein